MIFSTSPLLFRRYICKCLLSIKNGVVLINEKKRNIHFLKIINENVVQNEGLSEKRFIGYHFYFIVV